MAKERNLHRDLVRGGIYPVLFLVAVPLIFNNIIMSLYNLADGLWVAQLSMLEFSATSFVWPPHYLFVSLGIGLSIAGTAIIAQLIGQDDRVQASSYSTHLVWLCSGLGVLFAGVGYVLSPAIVRWMGAEGALARESGVYLSILLIGYVFDLIYLSFYAILGAQGKTKVTTIISALSSVLNVVIDPLFIFEREPVFGLRGLGLGISGAAWATVISQAFKMVLGIAVIRSHANEVRVHFRGVRPEWRKFSELVRVGFPIALGQSSAALGFTLLNSVVVAFGTATLGAYAAVNRISGFLTQASMGVGGAMTPIIGQNMGAGECERVRKFVRASFIVTTAISAVGALLQWFLRYPLLSLFNLDAEKNAALVWALALEYMLYSVLMTPFMGYFSLLSGIFSGTGYQSYAAVLSIGRLWVIRLPMIFFFQRFTRLGSEAVWISMLASNILIGLFGIVLYARGKWFTNPRLKH